jgi:hypothetical protein
VADDKDTVERAKEILVYGPLGLALYMRDTAPSFLKVFVARGRAEFDQRKRTVGEQLGQAKNVGQDTVSPGSSASAAASAAASTAAAAAPQVLRLVSDGLGKFRETAEGALEALGARGESPAGTAPPPASSPSGSPSPPASPAASPASSPAASRAASTGNGPSAARPAPSASDAGAPAAGATDAVPRLAIPDYDELSASQVVDRLDGLSPGALEAIRAYEQAHRGRATILGKIEQLGQTG